ncbi:probable chitinase 2 isoform X2 [Copidosoma floridanum]|uniref:probable chitinase 2 isoform X2 n=1 Tax=Copidosoma floridanum TaxID=29053 RepID=UPI0006C9C024|nr:probable chitinase 2 isoform X2 [Copidosoma floridanum]
MLSKAALLLAFAIVVVFGYSDDYNSNHRMMANENQTAVFCYINGSRLENQARRNPYQNNYFSIEHVKVDLCTHLVYGAAVLEPNQWTIRAINQDMEQGRSELARRKSNLQILISVSGSPIDFSNMARSHREHFAKNAKEFLRRHKFDGMNIDWQYPTRRGGKPEDKQNFGLLMKELKIAFRDDAKVLTASLSPLRQNVIEGYDYVDNVMMDSVDYWFVMAFEYYGHWSNRIGANAPIRGRERLGVEKTISDAKQLFQHHSYKLVLVVPFYGKKYQLKEELRGEESPINKDYVNLHAPSENVVLSYRDVCQKMSNEHGWRRGWDEDAKVPFIVKDMAAIVYEDAQSVKEKTSLALRQRLGGVMAFSLDMDDYIGDCSNDGRRGVSDNYNYNRRDGNNRNYPLLQSMYETVERGPNSAGLTSASILFVLVNAIFALRFMTHN